MRRAFPVAVVALIVACSSPEPPTPALPLGGPSLQDWAARTLGGPAERRIALTAEATWVDERPAIAFTMRNLSTGVLRLPKWRLPWGHVHSVDAIAMRDDGSVLGRVTLIDDPGPGNAPDLPPGGSLSGVYRLDAIPEIVPRLEHSAVVVLWSYRLKLGDGDDGSVITGVVAFSRRRR